MNYLKYNDFEFNQHLSHLGYLESEAIHIMREVISESINPVMLYSMGKDSAVMLHLLKRATILEFSTT